MRVNSIDVGIQNFGIWIFFDDLGSRAYGVCVPGNLVPFTFSDFD